jgi:prepilin peptidase CpaA
MTEALRCVAFLVFPVGMAFAAASDLLTMTISNRLTVILAVAFLLLTPIAGLDLHTFALHLATGAVVLAIAFACFAMGWIGGGDAKLAAVIALWFGVENAFSFLLLASLLGGALTLLILSFRGIVLPVFAVRHEWLARLHDRKQGVPYGIALAAAALAVYPQTVWMSLIAG